MEKNEERRNCFRCMNKKSLTWNTHISCADPPKSMSFVGGCGKGRGGTFDVDGFPNFDSAEERIEGAEKLAKKYESVVRCMWPGGGVFPFNFDPNSVFACCNFKENS